MSLCVQMAARRPPPRRFVPVAHVLAQSKQLPDSVAKSVKPPPPADEPIPSHAVRAALGISLVPPRAPAAHAQRVKAEALVVTYQPAAAPPKRPGHVIAGYLRRKVKCTHGEGNCDCRYVTCPVWRKRPVDD